MDYQTAKLRLCNHANLANEISVEESLIGSLWLADTGKAPLRFEKHVRDVLDCLQAVNIEMNGPDPAERIGPARNATVVLDVVYAVSGILSQGIHFHRSWSEKHRFSARALSDIEAAIDRIACA